MQCGAQPLRALNVPCPAQALASRVEEEERRKQELDEEIRRAAARAEAAEAARAREREAARRAAENEAKWRRLQEEEAQQARESAVLSEPRCSPLCQLSLCIWAPSPDSA